MTHDLYPPDMGARSQSAGTDADARALARELIVRRLLIAVAVVLLLACVVTSTVTIVLVRDQQVSRAPVTDSIKANTARIEDCTTPGKECYERGQRQLRSTVRELNAYGVAVAACASGPTERSTAYIVACVTEKLPRLQVPR